MNQQQLIELNMKIELYGRRMVTIGEQNFIHSEIDGGYATNMYITRFDALDQGCLTHIHGEKMPMRFCFQQDKIRTVTQIKRIIPTILRSLSHSKVLGPLYMLRNWKSYLDFIHYAMRDVFTEPRFYNQPTRDLYRAMSGHGIDKIRDILCAVMEYDSAYRYRFQNMLMSVDKECFDAYPLLETRRLIRLYSKREQAMNLLDQKTGKSIYILLIALWFKRKLIKQIVAAMNVKEFMPSPEDAYWMAKDVSYKYEIS